jgi:hypothetical protein
MRPSSFVINLIYRCEVCGSEHWVSSKEAQSRVLINCCGKQAPIEPINNIKLKLNYSTKPPKEALSILSQYGFSKKDIMNSGVKSASTEGFVKEFLARIENEPSTNKTL